MASVKTCQTINLNCLIPYFLEKVKPEIETSSSKNQIHDAISIQGYRDDQQDTWVVNDKLGIYCVFDGHFGSNASDYCKTRILQLIPQDLSRIAEELPKIFDQLHDELCGGKIDYSDLTELKDKCTRYKESIMKTPCRDSGTTATIVIVDKIRKLVYISNVGDSGCMLLHSGHVVYETRDHNPTLECEMSKCETWAILYKRIWVPTSSTGHYDMNLDKTLGDPMFYEKWNPQLKSDAINHTPDIKCIGYQDGDQIILMSDGMYSLSREKIVDLIGTHDSKRMVLESLEAGSRDNITFISVNL